jgi:hypothetical protein
MVFYQNSFNLAMFCEKIGIRKGFLYKKGEFDEEL